MTCFRSTSDRLMPLCALLCLILLSLSSCSAQYFIQPSSCSTPVFSPGQSAVRAKQGTVAASGIDNPSIQRQPVVLTNASTVLTINLYPYGSVSGTLRIAAALYDSSFPAINSTKLAQTAIRTVVDPQFPTDNPTPLSLSFLTPAQLPAGNYSIVFWKTWSNTPGTLMFFADSLTGNPPTGVFLDFFPTNNTDLDFDADKGILPTPWHTKFLSYGSTGPGFITSVNVESPCSLSVSSVSSSTGSPVMAYSSGSPSVSSFSPLSVLMCLLMTLAMSYVATMD